MSTFEGYVKSQEVDEVVIGPPLREGFLQMPNSFQIQRQLQLGLLDRTWVLLSEKLIEMVGWSMRVMFPWSGVKRML